MRLLNAVGRVLLWIDETIDAMVESGVSHRDSRETRRAEQIAILSAPTRRTDQTED